MKVCSRLHGFTIAALLSLALLLSPTLHAQAPRNFSYQGVITDFNGVMVSDGLHQIVASIYSVELDGTPLWSETQTVQTSKGVFTTTLGATVPIPDSIRFDGQLWLGIGVDGANELTPRTSLSSVPYALNTTRVNGVEGDLTVRGAGGAVVTTVGNVVTISTDTVGALVRTIISGDPGIVITNPNGPITTVGLADTGIGPEKLIDGIITTPKLDDASVTVEKLSGAGSTSGQVLMSNGGGVVWNSVGLGGGFSFPYTTSVTTTSTAFEINNGGSAGVAHFTSTPTGNSDPALLITSGSTASGSNYSDSVAGEAILAEMTATNSGAYDAAVRGINRGTNGAGAGVVGYHAGAGLGVYGESGGIGGIGVQGVANSNGTGVHGGTFSGIGVRGLVTQGNGKGGLFQVNNNTNTSIALEATSNGANGGAALRAYANGRGKGAVVQIDNPSNSDTALTVTTNGSGWGMSLTHTGQAGYGAYLATTNTLNSNPTLYATNAGSGRASVAMITNSVSTASALYAETQGSGNAVHGRVPAASSGYAVYSDGNAFKTAGGSTWSIPSDARLKQEVRPFTDGLDVLLKIEPVRFRYNGLCGTSSAHEEIGVIAQEMSKVAPYTVEPRALLLHPEGGTDERMEVMTYNSSALQYVTINAVKDLNAKVKEQQQTIESLQRELREMRETMQLLLQSRGVGNGGTGNGGGSNGGGVSVGP